LGLTVVVLLTVAWGFLPEHAPINTAKAQDGNDFCS
jgi:hypothetical protein